jgi:hypothetical protein
MRHRLAIIVFESDDEIFASPSINSKMEELGVGVALPEIADSGGLTFARSIQRGKTFHPVF